MALFQPSIAENIVLSSETGINEQGTVEIVLTTVSDTSNMLAALSGDDGFSPAKQSYREYAPTVVNAWDSSVNDVPSILGSLLTLRYKFLQFMKIYATEEEAKAVIWDQKMFEGLGIPPEDMGKAIEMLSNQSFLSKVSANLNTIFINFLKEKKAFSGVEKFRIKLVRSSETNHYSKIPKTQIDTWIEHMDVPKEQTKILWTQYDLDNNLNSGTPVASDKKDKKTEKKEKKKGKLMFGNRENGSAVEEQAPLTKKPNLLGAQ